jgi:TetR/AcrR family transcriptional regulator
MMSSRRIRDGENTKAAILEAAEALFAERGFDGTSISQIADKTGTSGPLIMFHFKDKRSLYQAVKASIVRRYTECSPPPSSHNEPFNKMLENMLKGMFAFYKDNPTMIRLSAWAKLEGDTDEWPGEAKWHHLYLDHFAAAQKKGEMRDDLTPYKVLCMISGAAHIWWEYHAHMLEDLGEIDDVGAADARYMQELLSLLQSGLSPEKSPANGTKRKQRRAAAPKKRPPRSSTS